ncbi:MAG: hypothetical protein U1D31_00345 [Patescibacteria group bacterium]|nr:hypothetical protein [bacterium]MDZ4240570.1 hypothetical protein [Patescibacteria group bacterium]
MRFAYGWSRWVFLVGNVAIKIPRLRPLHWISRFFFWKSQGKFTERFETHFKCNPVVGVWRYLCNGIIANIVEHRIYQKHPDLPIAPTLFSFLGLVNIQVRGKPLAESSLPNCPFRTIAKLHPQFVDLADIRNFAEINGKIVLVDCGPQHGFPTFEQILLTYKEQAPVLFLSGIELQKSPLF